MAFPLLRVMVDPGHGFSNSKPGVYDNGACSEFGSEAEIVAKIAADLADECTRSTPSVVETPACNLICVASNHPTSSHLGYLVRWINQTGKPFDFLIALHMNDSPDVASSGVEVYYSNGASATRRRQADVAAVALARVLGLTCRGAYPSIHSQHPSLGILDDTKIPALLFELGFVSNKDDVTSVMERGVAAVIQAIDAIKEVK